MTDPRPTPGARHAPRRPRLAAAALCALALSLPMAALPASARNEGPAARGEVAMARAPGGQAARKAAAQAVPSGRGQCVSYVHAHSDFRIQANAHLWWSRAAGIHARGRAPEVGSVLSFRSIRSMPLGHVALVSRIVDSREIEIDHNNWVGVGPVRGASVIDVSPNNDWTSVRVANRAGARVYGRVYPTDGFIHARPHGQDVVHVAARPAEPQRRDPQREREPG